MMLEIYGQSLNRNEKIKKEMGCHARFSSVLKLKASESNLKDTEQSEPYLRNH